MSFYYNARWGNPVQLQTIGAWRPGYSMGRWGAGYALSGDVAAGYSTPYETDDFEDEAYAKATKALGALKALLETPAAARNTMKSVVSIVPMQMDGVLKIASDIESSLAPVSSMIRAVPMIAKIDENRSVAGNIFDVVGPTRDPDPTLYAIYSAIHDMKEPEGEDGKVIIDIWKQIGQHTTTTHTYNSLSELSDDLGELYETYYNAYWDSEAAKEQSASGKPAAAKPNPKTGKPRQVPPKQQPLPTPRKGSNVLKYVLIGGGVLGALWLGMKFLNKR